MLISVGARILWWLASQTHGSFWVKSRGWRLRSSGTRRGNIWFFLFYCLCEMWWGMGVGETELPRALCSLKTRPLQSRGEEGVPGTSQHSPQPSCGDVGRSGQFLQSLEATAPGARPDSLFPPLVDASAGFTVDVSFIKSSFTIFQSELIVGNGTTALTSHVCSQTRTLHCFETPSLKTSDCIGNPFTSSQKNVFNAFVNKRKERSFRFCKFNFSCCEFWMVVKWFYILLSPSCTKTVYSCGDYENFERASLRKY